MKKLNSVSYSCAVMVLLFMIVVSLFSCQKKPAQPIQLTIGVESSLLSAAVWVAENKGIFKEAGLDVTIKEFDSGRLSFLDMLAGGVDISTTAPTPIMLKSFERSDFSILATFVHSEKDIKVICNSDKVVLLETISRYTKVVLPGKTATRSVVAVQGGKGSFNGTQGNEFV
jgi:ABC-type nitrate/sulfonate/bicarbonate transport system substrate-binding protein